MNPTERRGWLGSAISGTMTPPSETADTLDRDLPLVSDMVWCYENLAGPEEEKTAACGTLEKELLDAILDSGCHNKQDSTVATQNLKNALSTYREIYQRQISQEAETRVASNLKVKDAAWGEFMNNSLEPSTLNSDDLNRFCELMGDPSVVFSAIKRGYESIHRLQAFADPSVGWAQYEAAWGEFQLKLRLNKVSDWISSQSVDSYDGEPSRHFAEGSHRPKSNRHGSRQSRDYKEERSSHRRTLHREDTSRRTGGGDEGRGTHRRRTYW